MVKRLTGSQTQRFQGLGIHVRGALMHCILRQGPVLVGFKLPIIVKTSASLLNVPLTAYLKVNREKAGAVNVPKDVNGVGALQQLVLLQTPNTLASKSTMSNSEYNELESSNNRCQTALEITGSRLLSRMRTLRLSTSLSLDEPEQNQAIFDPYYSVTNADKLPRPAAAQGCAAMSGKQGTHALIKVQVADELCAVRVGARAFLSQSIGITASRQQLGTPTQPPPMRL